MGAPKDQQGAPQDLKKLSFNIEIYFHSLKSQALDVKLNFTKNIARFWLYRPVLAGLGI